MALSFLSKEMLFLSISVAGLSLACQLNLSFEQGLLSIQSIMVLLLSGLSILAWSWSSESLSQLKLLAEKASYIERRLDSLGASAAYSLRHLTEDIWSFDPQIGSEQVLRRWILRVRDEWLMRRSSLSWLYLSKAAEMQVRSELI